MSMINISNLTFGYEENFDNVFENVGFQIDTNWRLGFIGRNGRGKTTFLRLLLGELEYSGSISSDVVFEYFPYKIADAREYTIDIIRSICINAEDWEIYREISLLSLAEDTLFRQFNTLSNGERTKAMLAAMFLKHNSFLLIDEPTNHLDSGGRKKIAEYLKKKSGFILVSHDRVFLDSCIDHILVINKANIEVQKGNFSSWNENRKRQEQYEQTKNERLKKEIHQLEQTSKKVAAHSDKVASTKIGFDPTKVEKSLSRRDSVSKKAAKLMNRAKSMENRIEKNISEKNKLLQNVEEISSLKLSPLQYYSSQLIAFSNVSICYDGETIFSDVSFTVNQGDRIAVCGQNGSGKSSILKLICGDNIEYTGGIYKTSRLKISYVPQEVSGLSGNLEEYAYNNGVDISLFLTVLRKLGFDRSQFEKRLEEFSEGQKKKAAIAASLCTKAHLYVWDEPLNFIDIISRIQIEEVILKYKPTMIFVEHDEAFCRNIADKEIIL